MDEDAICFQAACRILAAGPQLTAQLRQKLHMKEFSQEAVNAAIVLCEKYGYLDDEALIERYIEREFAKGRGPYLIAAKLRDKVGRPIDDRVFSQITNDREIEKVEELLASGVEKRKLYQRGFSCELLQ